MFTYLVVVVVVVAAAAAAVIVAVVVVVALTYLDTSAHRRCGCVAGSLGPL